MAQQQQQQDGAPRPAVSDTAAMQRLVGVVQELSLARSLDAVMAIVRSAARELTGADGATFVLRDGDFCHYADEDAISPLWKGQRFPMSTCISGWVMLNGTTAVIGDIYKDARIPAEAYRPTFVKSLVMVPVRRESPVAAIGNYWAKQRTPTQEEVALLESIANVTSVAMENVSLYNSLQEKLHALEASNAELARFAWIASHDLKSPLRAIVHLSEWIEEDLEEKLEGESKAHMELLRQRAHRMEKLLDDILEYAKIDHQLAPRKAEIADGETLRGDIVSLVDLPASFTLSFADDFAAVRVPRLPLQRIFCNLIDNAIRHHDRGRGTIRIDVQDDGAHYLFSVADDGPGIAPQYRDKIFEMFQTLQSRDVRESSGMGLALVKKILLLHGGAITAGPAGKRGTVFRFSWPKQPMESAGG